MQRESKKIEEQHAYEQLQAIRAGMASGATRHQAEGHPTFEVDPETPAKQRAQVQKKKQTALTLQGLAKLKAEHTPGGKMHEAIETVMNEHRQVARSAKPAADTVDDALRAVAASQVKKQRALKHLQEAQQQYDLAMAEEMQAQEDLKQAETRAVRDAARASRHHMFCQQAAKALATTLEQIQASFHTLETGEVRVNPEHLNQIMRHVQTLATGPTSATSSPQRAVMIATPPDNDGVEVFATPVKSDAYLEDEDLDMDEDCEHLNRGTEEEGDAFPDELLARKLFHFSRHGEPTSLAGVPRFAKTKGNQHNPSRIIPRTRVSVKQKGIILDKRQQENRNAREQRDALFKRLEDMNFAAQLTAASTATEQ